MNIKPLRNHTTTRPVGDCHTRSERPSPFMSAAARTCQTESPAYSVRYCGAVITLIHTTIESRKTLPNDIGIEVSIHVAGAHYGAMRSISLRDDGPDRRQRQT